jgi:hypothetical protein
LSEPAEWLELIRQALAPTNKGGSKMAEATQQYHSHREVVTLARHISRECVKQELREQGHNLYRQYSFKQLCEQADEYLLAHIDEVFAEIRRQQEKVEP